jgi:hypothetical protein
LIAQTVVYFPEIDAILVDFLDFVIVKVGDIAVEIDFELFNFV